MWCSGRVLGVVVVMVACLGVAGGDMLLTPVEDPLEPVWHKLDTLAADIMDGFKLWAQEFLEANAGSGLQDQFTKLDSDVRTKLDAINNIIIHNLNAVTTTAASVDANVSAWFQTYYHDTMKHDYEQAYMKVENTIEVQLSALENKLLEHLDTKFSHLMSFNLTLPHHTPATATTSDDAAASSSVSSTDADALVELLNIKLALLDTKLQDVNSKLDIINQHVAKINDREAALEPILDDGSSGTAPTSTPAQGGSEGAQGGSEGAQGGSEGAQGGSEGAQGGSEGAQGGSGPAQGGSGAAQGGSGGAQAGDSCATLVTRVEELMQHASVSRDVLQELEFRLAEVKEAPTYLPRDCSDVHWYNHDQPSGVYTIYPTMDLKAPASAYCDMAEGSDKKDGGWTVMLRRSNTTWGLQDFNRTWDEYVIGFGTPGEGEWWFGLANLHSLTYRQPYQVRFDVHDIEKGWYYAHYSTFRVDDEGRQFQLIVDDFSGNVSSDAFKSKHDGRAFSTYDRDNDNWGAGSCAQSNGGGWWFNACHYTTLTAPFPTSADRDAKTIRWMAGEDGWLVFDDVTIKMRPTNYELRYDALVVA